MCFQRRDSAEHQNGGIEPWSNVCVFTQKKRAEDRMEISYEFFFELVYTG